MKHYTIFLVEIEREFCMDGLWGGGGGRGWLLEGFFCGYRVTIHSLNCSVGF